MREFLSRYLAHPAFALALVLLAAAALWLAGGLLWTVGVGAAIKAGTALAAIVTALAGMYIIRHVRGLAVFRDPALELIRSDPVALAINRGLYALGALICVGLVFS